MATTWYKQGTVNVTQGSQTVVGNGTLFLSQVKPGDSLTLNNSIFYEIESIESDTSLTLARQYAESTATVQTYAILRTSIDWGQVSAVAGEIIDAFRKYSSLFDKSSTTPLSGGIPVADTSGKVDSGWINDASETQKGVVELATAAEAQAGTDGTRAVTPATSGSRGTFSVTSTDNATSATSAPLKSAGGAAVAKDLWVGKSIVQTGVERYSKTYTGSGGANLLHLEAGEPPIMGDIFITELGTDHYLIGKFFKQNNTTLHIINVIDSNVLTLGAKNVQGSQVIDNYTASGNIRMKIIGYKMN